LVEYLYTKVLDISSIHISDVVKINATWLSMTDEEFQCDKLLKLYENRQDCEIITKMHKIRKGCDRIDDNIKVEIDGVGYHSCLCNQHFKFNSMNDLINLRNQYNNGNLPFTGGILEQPSQIIELIMFIDRLYNEYEIKELKKKE